jgi:hypothetical protein
MKIQSGFGILDVKHGRRNLEKHFKVKGAKPIPVTIQAEIVDQWGGDDGVSIEFELQVKSVKGGA